MHLLKKTAGGRAGDRDQPAPSTRNLLGRVEVVACSSYSITSLEQGGFKQQILWIKRDKKVRKPQRSIRICFSNKHLSLKGSPKPGTGPKGHS